MFENLQNIAIFEQLQFKGMNICTFSTKLPILVKISATVIEIMASNKCQYFRLCGVCLAVMWRNK